MNLLYIIIKYHNNKCSVYLINVKLNVKLVKNNQTIVSYAVRIDINLQNVFVKEFIITLNKTPNVKVNFFIINLKLINNHFIKIY